MALLVALCAGLFVAVEQTQAAALPAPPPAPAQQEEIPPEAGAAVPADDDEALGSDFLRAYDRLATGDAETPDGADPAATSPDPASWVGMLTFSLLLIVALIYGGLWLYKQYAVRRRVGPLSIDGQMFDGQMLAVQESQSIGPNQRLHVVRLGQETLLLGATDQTITLLARYDAGQTSVTFADHLQDAVRAQRATGAAEQPPPGAQTGDAQLVSLQESLDELRRVQQSWRGSRPDA